MASRNTRMQRRLFDLLIVLAGTGVTLLFLFTPSGGTPVTHGVAGADPNMSPPPPPPGPTPPPPPPSGGGGGGSCPPGYTYYYSNVNGQVSSGCKPNNPPPPPPPPAGNFTPPPAPSHRVSPQPAPSPASAENSAPALPTNTPTAVVAATPPDPGPTAEAGAAVDGKLVADTTPKEDGPNRAGQAAGGVLAVAAVAAVVVRPKSWQEEMQESGRRSMLWDRSFRGELYTPDEEKSGCATIKSAFGIRGEAKPQEWT
jgi:hypothetical protein